MWDRFEELKDAAGMTPWMLSAASNVFTAERSFIIE
jgi:hypothetical protein